VLIGGKAKVGLPLKLQFTLGQNSIAMNGVVKGINFDEKKSRSLLHVQALPPSPSMRNRLLTYVYNLFGERPVAGPPRKDGGGSNAKPEGIMLKAAQQNPNQSPRN